ncbi:similar to Saccharomyces cerevisiae YHR091C MSR1 Mitochondrial arginyl-tRNA synthetase [Maudiozyma saulgeensis]|uniref:arginine--tRNA ligase n=1 Tax=Maudiozyma saulgeensis TaxID=1789683 RepID=A0A1X7QWZ4_9SACH|nr:similar to Saccharomyces cerevisiae YHR091C MSR1 Mitochondrial arginyl-tRNA synthetase [Kazachstania saulgeensis]
MYYSTQLKAILSRQRFFHGLSRTTSVKLYNTLTYSRCYSLLSTPNCHIKELEQLSQRLNHNEEIADAISNQNVMGLLKVYISSELSRISGIEADKIFKSIQWNSNLEDSDLVLPLPRLGKQIDKPNILAEKWAKAFPTNDYIQQIEFKGPFLKFFVSPKFLFKSVIPHINATREFYGFRKLQSKKKALVEFSSPNIAKPFHAGHLRSTIIGGFLSNLYHAMGWEVIRMNYLGDWGKQFGLLAVGYYKYGNKDLLKSDPIHHLFDVYVKVNKDKEQEIREAVPVTESIDHKAKQFFRKMESGDVEALKLWQTFRSLSIEKYIQTYSRLNIQFDIYSGESQVPREIIQRALEMFKTKNLLEESDGATLIDLTKFNKKLGKTIIKKTDGTTLYLTRDVGAAIDRYEKYHFDKMIYVIATQQDLYVSQLFETIKQLGFKWANNLEHVNFGMVKGMSTRKGTVVFLDNILEEAKQKVLATMQRDQVKYSRVEHPEKIADIIGVSAVMIQDMQSKRINNYEFEWNRMLSFEGDTGPYLQYTHSRLHSIANNHIHLNACSPNFDLLVENEAVLLIRLLAQYPDVLVKAMRTQEPCTVVTYLFKVAHQVSSCYTTLWVTGQPQNTAVARLALYNAARQVISNGMRLLGLTPVNRM